jgi:membrane protease YdiL (CAAX protease family)
MLTQKAWRAEAVIQLVAGVMACLCLGAVMVALLRKAGMPAFGTTDSFGSVLVATLSFQGAALVLIFLFLKIQGLSLRKTLGLEQPGWKKSLLLAAGVMVVAMPFVLGLQQVSVMTLEKIGWVPEDQRAIDLLANSDSVWLRGYMVFFAIVLAPAAEEFIFRGILFPFVKQLGWPRFAWFGVSGLFALIHLNAPAFFPLFVLALVLTWLYEWTDCLLASIVAHSLFNAANLVILYFQSR